MYGHKKCRYRFAASYRFVILDTANMGIIFEIAKRKTNIFTHTYPYPYPYSSQ